MNIEAAKAEMARVPDNRTEAERHFHNHISMWGSAGYPVRKLRNGKWLFEKMYGAGGTPIVYATKREAVAAVEACIEILCDKAAGRL